jgi:hypothetical protein
MKARSCSFRHWYKESYKIPELAVFRYVVLVNTGKIFRRLMVAAGKEGKVNNFGQAKVRSIDIITKDK